MSKETIFDYKKELDKYKSLSEIFFAARQIETNKFNNTIFFISTIIVIIITLLALTLSLQSDLDLIHPLLISASSYVYAYSVGIVGFLIAGLAILISIDRGDLFLLMARNQYKNTTLSSFQFLFFTCIRTLIFHIILLSSTLVINIFGAGGQTLLQLISNIMNVDIFLSTTFNGLLLIVISSLAVRCILVIKSFVYNIYESVVLTLLISDYKDIKSKKS